VPVYFYINAINCYLPILNWKIQNAVNVIFMGPLKHHIYKVIISMKKIDFYFGFKDFNILAVDSNPRISISRNIPFFIEKTFLLKYVIISIMCASVVSLNHLLFP